MSSEEAQVLMPKPADFAALLEVKGDMSALCNLPCQQACRACSCRIADAVRDDDEASNEYRFSG